MKLSLKKINSILSFSILSLIALSLLSHSSDQDGNFRLPKNDENRPVRDYNIYAVDLPSDIEFAQERVPLEIRDVRERLDRELLVNTYWQSNGLLLIKRANKYFPIIEPILEKNNIPNDFKYLALIESGLQNIVSPVGAAGFWQFMKTTAKEYGLEVNNEIDERYHLEKATQAACDYLNKMKNEFGSWTLAAAAYNAGKAGINSQIIAQKQNNYYNLHLNTETSRYIFRILALKEIMKRPFFYGFNFTKNQLYNRDAVKFVEIDYSIDNWADFALENGTNYKMLRIYNPWIRSMSLNNKSKKKYKIEIPN